MQFLLLIFKVIRDDFNNKVDGIVVQQLEQKLNNREYETS